MTKRSLLLAPACALLACAVLAGAASDVIVRERQDDERNTIYELINTGERQVAVKVRLTKTCSGQTNDSREPKTMNYFLGPKETLRLGRAWSGTSCVHDYRIVEAEYRD